MGRPQSPDERAAVPHGEMELRQALAYTTVVVAVHLGRAAAGLPIGLGFALGSEGAAGAGTHAVRTCGRRRRYLRDQRLNLSWTAAAAGALLTDVSVTVSVKAAGIGSIR